MKKEKKERCDHILGLDDYGNMIRVKDNEEYAIIDFYNYCPECGKKLLNTAKISNVEDKE